MQDFLQRKLGAFAVDGEDEGGLIEDGRGGDCKRFLIFLAPAYHILLEVAVAQTSSVVRVCTDNWKVLPYLQTYLQRNLGA